MSQEPSMALRHPRPAPMNPALGALATEGFVHERKIPATAVRVVRSGEVLDGPLRVTDRVLVICGRVNGDVEADGLPIYILASGHVTGQIRCAQELVVAGMLGSPDAPTGDVFRVHGAVHLGATAQVFGDGQAQKAVVYQGARMTGSIMGLSGG